ncbi:hypothetical protein MKW92_046202 [Papaver armeniacum]|nr:hypothetical protein MKW92_046202 [Papaver armeniacum]
MEAYPMNGGNGPNSYASNSFLQKFFVDRSKSMIDEAIADYLDIQICPSSSTFRIADLGCSAGPNTFIAMQNIIEAVDHKYRESQGLSSLTPEFHVYFNDHTSNDFNTLFVTLPPEKSYFAAGVPGSFHTRLFPKGTLHVVHSSLSIQWLSQVPKEVLDISSPAYNRGRIHYTNARQEVFEAYSAQYAKDIEAFLHARAEEVVCGGLVVLIVPAVPDESPPSQLPTQSMFDILGSCLMEMAKTGIMEEAEVDSFNLPAYSTTPCEFKKLVERNGCFNIERIVDILPQQLPQENKMKPPVQILSDHFRAALEGVIKSHFRFDEHVLDHLFQHLYPQKIEDTFASLTTHTEKTTTLFTANRNNLDGSIPESMRMCTKLSRVRLEDNILEGVTDAFGVYPLLEFIDLSRNQLSGELSPNWGLCTRLGYFRTSEYMISGEIPPVIASLKSLEDISLSSNKLSGHIPVDMFNPESNIFNLNLSSNQFSDKIPTEIGKLARLRNLDLSVNNLSGPIPGEIEDCQDIISLKLNNNKLNGPIPHQGPVPDVNAFKKDPVKALGGNQGLCSNELKILSPCSGTPSSNNRSKTNKWKLIIAVVVPVAVALVLLILFGIFCCRRNHKVDFDEKNLDSGGDRLFSVWFKDIVEATENFDEKYCIGKGGQGSVYKATLQNDRILAVKRFHDTSSSSSEYASSEATRDKSFESEVRAMTDIRHQNIVKMYGFSLMNGCMFLAYEYVERGSLENVLYNEIEAKMLDWSMRIKIIKGVVHALFYLHHDCTPPIVHRDITGSNILLNPEYEAKISDFGTARLLKPDASNWTVPVGSYGYIAPVSELLHWKSYSETPREFLLHLLSEGHDRFLADALDKRLTLPTGVIADELVLIATLALACTRISPNSRPTMHFVSRELTANTVLPINENFHLLTLQKLLKVL